MNSLIAAEITLHGSTTVTSNLIDQHKADIESKSGHTLNVVANGSSNGIKGVASDAAQKATEDISQKVIDMQEKSSEALRAVQVVTKSVVEMSETADQVSRGVDDQAAATREIAQSAAQASRGTTEVTQNIVSVKESAQKSGKSAEDVLSVANDLADNASSMKMDIDSFSKAIKAV